MDIIEMESVMIQLRQMIEYISYDKDYFLTINEKPLVYANQMWLGHTNQVLKIELKISKENIKV